MAYINNEKQRDKTYLINNLASYVTDLGVAFNDIINIIHMFEGIASGLQSGLDNSTNQHLLYAKNYIENARKTISVCQQLAHQLNVEEEEETYGQYGNYY